MSLQHHQDLLFHMINTGNFLNNETTFLPDLSGSAMVIEMFFKAIMQFRPDLILLSGIHVLEAQVQTN